MTAYRAWPFAALVIAVLFYSWNGEDEPEPEPPVQPESQVGISPPVRHTDAYQAPIWDGYEGYPSPVDPYGDYSMGYTMRGGNNPTQFSSPGGYRFRPNNARDTSGNRVESSYPLTQPSQGYSTIPLQPYQNLQGHRMGQQYDSTYRFRPLDKKQQTKRWTGNYTPAGVKPAQPSSPYAYDRYPVPAYPAQLPSEPNPLWANSWPER